MSKLLTNNEHKKNYILNYLLEKLTDNNVDIASPFVSRNDLLDKIVANNNKTRLVVKLHKNANFELLQSLLQKGHFDIKFFYKDFHAKYYRIQSEIIVGSSNFMSRGLRNNKEINIVVDQEDAIYQELLDTFEDYWNEAEPLTCHIVEFCKTNANGEGAENNRIFRRKLENFLAKNRENAKGKKVLTDEHKQKIAEGAKLANSKPVRLINTLERFDSMKIAAMKIYGYRRGYGYISDVCKNQKKHYKRKVWMFEEDFLKLSPQEQENRKGEALKLEESNAKIKRKEYFIYKNRIYKSQKDLSIQLKQDGYIDKSNTGKVENWYRNLSSRLGEQKEKNCPFLQLGEEFIFFATYHQEYKDKNLINEVPEEEPLEEISRKYYRILDINLGDLTIADLLNSASDKFYKHGGDYFKSKKSMIEKYKEPQNSQFPTLTKEDVISELEFLFEDANLKN